MGHQNIFEAPESALPINACGELATQVQLFNERDKPLHPTVLLPTRNRGDANVGRVSVDTGVHLRVGNAVHHAKDVAGRKMQIRMEMELLTKKEHNRNDKRELLWRL